MKFSKDSSLLPELDFSRALKEGKGFSLCSTWEEIWGKKVGMLNMKWECVFQAQHSHLIPLPCSKAVLIPTFWNSWAQYSRLISLIAPRLIPTSRNSEVNYLSNYPGEFPPSMSSISPEAAAAPHYSRLLSTQALHLPLEESENSPQILGKEWPLLGSQPAAAQGIWKRLLCPGISSSSFGQQTLGIGHETFPRNFLEFPKNFFPIGSHQLILHSPPHSRIFKFGDVPSNYPILHHPPASPSCFFPNIPTFSWCYLA